MMAGPESKIQKSIHAALGSRPDVRLFRQNVGQGWTGSDVGRFDNGAIVIHDARPLRCGLCKGSSDLIGLQSVTVTPEMVGRTLAVFVAVEVKAARGRATQQQRRFLDMVERMGGLSGVARSVDEAEAILGPDGLPVREG